MFGKEMARILLVLAVTLGISASTMGADILFISAMDDTTKAGDDALKGFLEGLGHTVTYFDDDATEDETEEAAAAADLVFISESVSSGKVRTEITEVATPMVITEAWAYDEMGLTIGTGEGTNVTTPNIEIVAPGHQLAAGLSGTVPVLTALASVRGTARFATGRAGQSATVIARATLSDGATYDVIWAYEKDAVLPVAPADGSPQRAADVRVCLGFDELSYLVWNDNAYALFKAAIDFGLGFRVHPEAYNPSPANGDVEVLPGAVLMWEAGIDADTHNVYFGTDLSDVSEATVDDPRGVLVSLNQGDTTWDPGTLLGYGQTCCWRVDEVAADGEIVKGSVWQFMMEPRSYPMAGSLIAATASHSQAGSGPERTIDGSGLDAYDGHSTAAADMWQSGPAIGPVWIQYEFDKVYKLHEMLVWNYNGDLEFLAGFGLKDVTVQYSDNGVDWTVLGDFEFAQGLSAPGYAANTHVDFAGTLARFVRLTANSAWGSSGWYGLSEVRFQYIPMRAREPSPASGDTEVEIGTILTWRAGRNAASHEVVFGTDEQAVVAGTALAGVVEDCQYPPDLDLSETYYWKVNEVNQAEPIASWAGDVWTFTTADFIVVDDFEQYTNRSPNRLFQTWLDGAGFSADEFFPDGYAGNGTGALVGYDPQGGNIMETFIVHGGGQSMPFMYDNTGRSKSETTRMFDEAQDFTHGGATALTLYFQGAITNVPGQMYVKIDDARVNYAGDAADLTMQFWIRWQIDLGAANTDLTTVKSLTIGVDNGGYGTVLFDDVRLYRQPPAAAVEDVWVEAEAADSIVAPMRVYSDRADASGGRYIASFGDNSTGSPPDNGVASYALRLTGGTYRIVGRVIAPTGNDDSFWVRLQGATTNTVNHVSRWVQWGLDQGETWHDVPVRSMDDADETVLFTVEPGLYNLEIAYREDGALLDAWMITRQLQ
jgi:hypothetical protein